MPKAKIHREAKEGEPDLMAIEDWRLWRPALPTESVRVGITELESLVKQGGLGAVMCHVYASDDVHPDGWRAPLVKERWKWAEWCKEYRRESHFGGYADHTCRDDCHPVGCSRGIPALQWVWFKSVEVYACKPRSACDVEQSLNDPGDLDLEILDALAFLNGCDSSVELEPEDYMYPPVVHPEDRGQIRKMRVNWHRLPLAAAG
jgi:hypothetical protein